MKFIIMCGSNNGDIFDEKPRQTYEIKGEEIIARTIRLLREARVNNDDIYISSQNPIYDNYGVKRIIDKSNTFVHENKVLNLKESGYWVDCFCPLNIPATYILGDVYFSEDCIKKIVEYKTESITFFATKPPYDPKYIKKHAEPLAYKVVDQVKFRKSINWVKSNFNKFNRHPIAWELWEVINNQPINKLYWGGDLVDIHDYTCDIDAPRDIKSLEEIL